MDVRASSLADRQVIQLLTRYFVPALITPENGELLVPGEGTEFWHICQACEKRGFKHGTVWMYIVNADGTAEESIELHSISAARLHKSLRRIVDAQKLEPRSPEAIKASAAVLPRVPKAKQKGGLVLHLVAGYR